MALNLEAEWLAERDALILALLGQCFRVGLDGQCSWVRPLVAATEETSSESTELDVPALTPYLRAIAAKARALGTRCQETVSRATAEGRTEVNLHAVPLASGAVLVVAHAAPSKSGALELSALIHDLTNPLTYVLASLGLLRESLAERSLERHPDVGELLEALEDGIGRIHRVVRHLSARGQSAPPYRKPAPAESEEPPPLPESTTVARVLVVDDEPQLLESLARLLAPHEVETASCGAEALDMLAHGLSPEVIFCDVMMPGMDGLELVSTIVERWPHLASRVVFVTGGVSDPVIARRLSELPIPVLEKPLRDGPLRQHIARIVEQHRDEGRESHYDTPTNKGSQVA